MQNPLILVSDPIEKKQQNDLGLSSHGPRHDYAEIARLLAGEIAGPRWRENLWHRGLRQIEERIRLNVAEAVWASCYLNQHTAVLSTSEKVAIPLAAALTVTRQAIPHIVIAHKLSSLFKTTLFRAWPLQNSFSFVICVCRAQADYAVEKLGLPESAVKFVFDKVDHRFFRPSTGSSGEYILAVGQEQRDYQTLLRAVSGTGIKLVIVASSPWSGNRLRWRKKALENVTIVSHIPYLELRELYANARLVVAPLFDVPYAAGVNTTLEAMAMAKPLVVSQTTGIRDYVVPGETGVFAPAQNPQALRDVLLRLWEQPGERQRLGMNARQSVEEKMNLDIYARQVAQIVFEAGNA